MAQAGSSRIDMDMPRARARGPGWQDENEDDERSYTNMPFDGIQRFCQAISDLEVRCALPLSFAGSLPPSAPIPRLGEGRGRLKCAQSLRNKLVASVDVPHLNVPDQDWLHPHCLCCHPRRFIIYIILYYIISICVCSALSVWV